MQGMLFVIMNKDGKAINHGLIAQQITPEKYLCQFAIPAPSNRIVAIEEVQGYTLFNNQEQMNTFLAAIQKLAPTPKKKEKFTPDPRGPHGGGKVAKKKKVRKSK